MAQSKIQQIQKMWTNPVSDVSHLPVTGELNVRYLVGASEPYQEYLWDGSNYILLGSKLYDLPAPQWEEIRTNGFYNLIDGYGVYGDDFGARVPLVDQTLITDGQLYVEYGRIKRTYSRGSGYENRMRGSKIEWYSPRVSQNAVNGRGYSAGTHNTIPLDRPNMFPVTKQGFLSPALPRNAFYRTVNAEYYSGDHSDESNSSQIIYYPTPHMTGGRVHKIALNMFNSTSSGNRRPQNAQLKTKTHQASEWYARLVVIKDGKVIQQGPHSEPLFLSWTGGNMYWNEFERKYSTLNSYAPRNANLTIGHKQKQ